MVKLDLGCGKNKKEGYIGVDSREFPGVDVVHDLTKPWPWQDETVDDIHCSHLFEHFKQKERIFFANEAYRVLKKGAKLFIQVPDWGSGRAYGDLTHEWPPVVAMHFAYWSKAWRASDAPHLDSEFNPDGFKCDFDFGAGWSLPAEVQMLHPDAQRYRTTYCIEARGDLMVTLTKK